MSGQILVLIGAGCVGIGVLNFVIFFILRATTGKRVKKNLQDEYGI